MLTADEVRQVLSGRVDGSYLQRVYGVSVDDTGFVRQLNEWCRRMLGRRFSAENGSYDRVALEEYMALEMLGSRKTLGLAFGLGADAFSVVVEKLGGMVFVRDPMFHDDSQLLPAVIVDKMFSWAFQRPLPVMKSKTQGVLLFRHVVEDAFSLELDVLIDETGEALGDHVACNALDVFTGTPLARKYAVWLQLGKPMSLPPDHASIRTTHELVGRGLLPEKTVLRMPPAGRIVPSGS